MFSRRRALAWLVPALLFAGVAPATAATPLDVPIFRVASAAVPDAVTNLSTVRGNSQIDVTFAPPADDGGDPIIGYEVSSDDGANWYGIATSNGSAPNTLTGTVGGLNNGTTYVIRVRAVNNVGRSAVALAPAAKPAQTPHAPSLNLTAGDGSITAAFTPSFDGGEPILRWEITLNGGSSFNTFTPTPDGQGGFTYTATGLANGAGYSVGVRGVNAVGDGFSGKAMSLTPARRPDAPAITSAARGNQSIELTFGEPADGGDPITGYEVSTDNGQTYNLIATSAGSAPNTLTALVGPLNNGTSYALRLRAVNGVGASAATTAPARTPATVPAAPAINSLTPGDSKITVNFTPNADDGGEPVTRWEITLNGGGSFSTFTPTPAGNGAFTYVAPGLANGNGYSVGVRGVNAVGDGFSGKAMSVTPALTAPAVPPAFVAASRDSAIDLTFGTPDDGGSAITKYEVQLDNGQWTTLATSVGANGVRTARIANLNNNQDYTVAVRAVNAIGDGVATQTQSVTPYVASTPQAPSASASTSSITASWNVPNPSTNITGYTAYASPGPASCTTTSVSDTSCVLGGEAGTTYTITVVAHGANGVDSPASPVSAPITPALPPTPAQPPANVPLTLTTDKGQIALAVPDQPITVIGTGFAPHSTAKVIIYSTPQELGTVVTDANGNFSVAVRVPAGLHAGSHTFLATGVDPSGGPRAMALPVTVPPTSVDSNGGGDSNNTQLPIPTGGSITLLDAAGTATTTVTFPGQGTYVLDAATGTISFVPVKGFSGRATAVTYRLTDAVGSSVTGTYAAVVTAAATGDEPTTGTPVASAAGIRRAGRLVARGGSVPVTCTLSTGTLSRCTVDLYAKLSGRSVKVGTGTAKGAKVTVRLTAAGRGIVARPGGTHLTARATVNGTLIAARPLAVVAAQVKLPRLVMFASGSAAVSAADRAYLRRVSIKGARTVTCFGHTDNLGQRNVALGRLRAAAVCRILTAGTKVRTRVVTRADEFPRASNSTLDGRAANRRATITVAY